ncbi:leucine-rich repeat protein [Paenibacillus sp. CAU 1782]
MRKSLLCLLIALIAFGTSLTQIQVGYAAEVEFIFTTSNNVATVTGYSGTEVNVVIPETLSGVAVTSIGRSAFDTYGTAKPKLASVVIPNSVVEIQTYAFRYNSLTSIDLPDNLLRIGASAFENNPLTSVVFPDSVTSIGNYAFYMSDLTSITLSENLKTISGGAFDTNKLTRLVIPSGVTTVQSSAFYANNLTSVTVLGAETSFGVDVFRSNPGNLKLFGIANSPAATYAANSGHEFVDGTALFQAVATAKTALANHLPGTGVGQVPANAYSNLTAAYDVAIAFVNGIGNATVVSDLVTAAMPLTAAISAFEGQIIRSGNPAALGTALTEAGLVLSVHSAGTNAGQTSEGNRSALQFAIDAARQIYNQAGIYRQDELDVAVAELDAAIDTFMAAIIPAGDPTVLGTAIANAQQVMTNHPQGENVGQTSSATHIALQTAVNTAQQILQNASQYSQSQLDTAVANLETAKSTFESAIIPAGDVAELEDLLEDATRMLVEHPQGIGVGQTSASDRSALQAAINAAQAIADESSKQTQNQLNAAVANLETAKSTFESAIIPAGDVTELEDLLVDATRMLVDHPQGAGVGQASASDRSALQAAINAAQAIADEALKQTQNQLNAAVANLETAKSTFESVIIPAGDVAELEDLLVDVTQMLADHPQGAAVGQASASDRSALQAAINAAQAIADEALKQTQNQLNAAVAELETAMDTFESAIIPAGDVAELEDLLEDATRMLVEHPQGTGVGQASASTRNALQAAINAAQAIADEALKQTQNQLNAAVANLKTAKSTFESAIILAGDVAELEELLEDATRILVDHPLGTGVGQASASARNALQAAINAAQAIADEALKQTQNQLNAAVAELETAMDTFESAIIPAGDVTELEDLLVDATRILVNHPQGIAVGQASASDRSALQAAINAAQAIADEALKQTQNQLNAAVAELETAMDTFESAIIPAGDVAELEDLLEDATRMLVEHPQGTGVGQASASTRNALQAAINAAQAIADEALKQTQSQLDAAVANLKTAKSTFESAIILAGDVAELEDLLVDATEMLVDHPQGTGVGQASASDRSALQAAINAAQAIADEALKQTQSQLDAAVAELGTAMDTFESAWVGGELTAPANKLYGPNNVLHFTVRYGYGVIVAGTPVVPLRIGASSNTRTVNAEYTGTHNEAMTELTFEYKVPAGMVDEDGIEVAAALELPDDASIVRASGGAASLAFGTPDTSGVYIVSISPDVVLTAEPDGSRQQVIRAAASVYGEAAGNALVVLRWLKGNLNAADFMDGGGSDILSEPRFTVSENGEYTVFARDEAGNDTVKVIAVTGISTPSQSFGGDRPASSSTVTINQNGGISAIIDSSVIKQIKSSDGTLIEQVILSERMEEQVLELLREAKEPLVTIVINDQEHTVQTQLSAAWIAEIAKAYPNAIIEAQLNGSSYQLQLNALDLDILAERLDTDLSNMTVSIIQEQVGEDIRNEIERLGVSQGFTVFGGIIDFKVTAEANGKTLEVQNFGESYMARTIRLGGGAENRNLVSVMYNPATGTIIFVPASLSTRTDGSLEAILKVPHNSIYTVVDVKARTFSDLTGHWAKADVDYLASKLLVYGLTADRFSPDGTITRAEFLALLVRGLGLTVKENEDSSYYSDVLETAWYAPVVNAAVANRLATGISAESFAPNAPITREQMAVIIDKALTFSGHANSRDMQAESPLISFADFDHISTWAQSAVARVSEVGIIKGMEDGRFAPTGYATRAQAAVMLKRLLQYLHHID